MWGSGEQARDNTGAAVSTGGGRGGEWAGPAGELGEGLEWKTVMRWKICFEGSDEIGVWSRALAVEGTVGELLPTPMCDASGNSGRGVQDGLLGHREVSSICNSGLPRIHYTPNNC